VQTKLLIAFLTIAVACWSWWPLLAERFEWRELSTQQLIKLQREIAAYRQVSKIQRASSTASPPLSCFPTIRFWIPHSASSTSSATT
jgi:hypothetical protein